MDLPTHRKNKLLRGIDRTNYMMSVDMYGRMVGVPF